MKGDTMREAANGQPAVLELEVHEVRYCDAFHALATARCRDWGHELVLCIKRSDTLPLGAKLRVAVEVVG